jgi:tryptophanyl-tRNA synthetase
MKKVDYKVDVFTGIRPTGGLTIANVIGSVHTIVKLQNEKEIGRPMVFVADLHALTDAEPKDTQKYILDVVKDYIALGLNPQSCDIFVHSQLIEEISELNLYLSRLVTISELLRVPTLKEKIKKDMDLSNASLLLAMYPVMMSSDILLQKSKYVPVGDDQVAHVEMARYLARKFNKGYGETIPIPNVLSLGKPIRIKSLLGEGKMSKSNPNGAILLDDPINISLSKIKKAQTAFAGEKSDSLDSLVHIGMFVSNEEEKKYIEEIMNKHMGGENVMGELKGVICNALERYLKEFQDRKSKISDSDVYTIISKGNSVAKGNAKEMIKEVRNAMQLKYTQ